MGPHRYRARPLGGRERGGDERVERRVDGRWQLARREIRLGQNVLLAKNLTMFF